MIASTSTTGLSSWGRESSLGAGEGVVVTAFFAAAAAAAGPEPVFAAVRLGAVLLEEAGLEEVVLAGAALGEVVVPTELFAAELLGAAFFEEELLAVVSLPDALFTPATFAGDFLAVPPDPAARAERADPGAFAELC